VLDAGSYTSGIAEGSIFVVKGTNLSASGFSQFGFKLPTACTAALCNGAASGQITFTPTSGGAGTQAYLVYLYNQSGVNQLAAILPSTLAAGNYNVTVTNNTGAVSAPFQATVVKSKPEVFTQDTSGSGMAVVQNYISQTQLDIDRLTVGSVSGITISPARPGQTLIAWLTGLGPIPTADNDAAPVLDVTKSSNVQVIVGGMTITPAFAGRAPGLAGEDQVDFVLPANVPTGCAVSFQISVNGVLSNPTSLAIAADQTSGACVLPGFTTSQLQALDNGGNLTTGAFTVTQFSISENFPGVGLQNAKVDTAAGSFIKYTGFQIGSYQNFATASNSCTVATVGGTSPSIAGVGGTALDAGAVSLTGPSGSNITNLALTETANAYAASIATEIAGISIPGQSNMTVIGGQYSLKGAGGKDVGAFSASMNLGTPLTITGGLPTTVTRNAGLPLKWTGGNANDLVLIAGSVSSGANSTTEFLCTTTAGAGGFTVPASILTQIPTSSGTNSFLLVESSTSPTSGNGLFSAPLTAGGNVSGTFLGLIGSGATVTYQ
jgi:uncharacterized protein (TIGR03437 family)